MTKKQETKGRHVRFPKDVDRWLEQHARKFGYSSVPELVKEIVRDKKQEAEAVKQQKAA